MSVLKIKKLDGTWERISSSSNIILDTTLSNSGMAADAKAVGDAYANLSNTIGNLSSLNTVNKDNLVNAINESSVSSKFLIVDIDYDNNISSHSASEIIEAVNSGKYVIITNGPEYRYSGSETDDNGDVCVYINFTHLYDDGEFYIVEYIVHDDKTITQNHNEDVHAVRIITVDENNVASAPIGFINEIIYEYNGVVLLHYNNNIYNYQYGNDDSAHFVCFLSNGETKFVSVVYIDKNSILHEVNTAVEPLIPAPNSVDVGKILSVDAKGQLYWGDAPSGGDGNGGESNILKVTIATEGGDDNDNTIYGVSSHSATEIINAINQGKVVICQSESSTLDFYNYYTNDDNTNTVCYLYRYIVNPSLEILYTFDIYDDKTFKA
jgi:hypothetical protein